jgi:glycosyltransferase involved in cell wall biosynthesis
MHFRAPFQNAGSEVAMHTVLKAFQAAGHDVAIITTDTPQAPDYEVWDGMECFSPGNDRQKIYQVTGHYRPDAIITHHQRAEVAVPMAHLLKIPSIAWIHNDFPHNRRVFRHRPTLTLFNTHWIKEKLAWGGNSMVVHPPVFPQVCEERLAGENRVTLINLNADKGGHNFYQLAKALPSIQFLGVVGAHGHQIILEDHDNVRIQPHTSNMCLDVWAHTSLLLVPSIYESYGMVGLEAASLGIPVIAAPTPGLKESLDFAGLFIPRDNIAEYVGAIRALMYDSREYSVWSQRAKERFAQVDTGKELATLVETVERMTCKSV